MAVMAGRQPSYIIWLDNEPRVVLKHFSEFLDVLTFYTAHYQRLGYTRLFYSRIWE